MIVKKVGMRIFKAFFSLNPKQIRETVIVSPIVYPQRVGKAKVNKSILSYLVANYKKFTFIKTPMTQSAVSDLLVLLNQTKCQQIIFIGALGGLDEELKIGDIIIANGAKKIYSFSSIHEETEAKFKQLKRQGFIGFDFETQAFFATAKQIKKPAMAFYVVTDLPFKKPFYKKKTKKEKEVIQKTVQHIIKLVSADL